MEKEQKMENLCLKRALQISQRALRIGSKAATEEEACLRALSYTDIGADTDNSRTQSEEKEEEEDASSAYPEAEEAGKRP